MTEVYLPFIKRGINLALLRIIKVYSFCYAYSINMIAYFKLLFGPWFGGWIICASNYSRIYLFIVRIEFLWVSFRDTLLRMKGFVRDSVGKGLEKLGNGLARLGQGMSTKKPTSKVGDDGLIQFFKPTPTPNPPTPKDWWTAGAQVILGTAAIGTLAFETFKYYKSNAEPNELTKVQQEEIRQLKHQNESLTVKNDSLTVKNEVLNFKVKFLEEQLSTGSQTKISVSKTQSTTSEVNISNGLKDIPNLQNTSSKPIINSIQECVLIRDDFQSIFDCMSLSFEICSNF